MIPIFPQHPFRFVDTQPLPSQVVEYVKSLKGCANLVDHLSHEGGAKDTTGAAGDRKMMYEEHVSLYQIKQGIKSNR